jgi:hypothetical protein
MFGPNITDGRTDLLNFDLDSVHVWPDRIYRLKLQRFEVAFRAEKQFLDSFFISRKMSPARRNTFHEM